MKRLILIVMLVAGLMFAALRTPSNAGPRIAWNSIELKICPDDPDDYVRAEPIPVGCEKVDCCVDCPWTIDVEVRVIDHMFESFIIAPENVSVSPGMVLRGFELIPAGERFAGGFRLTRSNGTISGILFRGPHRSGAFRAVAKLNDGVAAGAYRVEIMQRRAPTSATVRADALRYLVGSCGSPPPPPQFRYAVLVDVDSYDIEDAELEAVTENVAAILLERAGIQAVMVARVDGVFTEEQREEPNYLQAAADAFVADRLDLSLNGIVIFTAAPDAVAFGGFLLNTSDLSGIGYCNGFNSPHFTGEHAYGGVIDWSHRYAQCGASPATDPVACASASVPALSNYCGNQASDCIWNTAGYCMCAGSAGLPYADPAMFRASSIVHEWLHNFGRLMTSHDHYCADSPTSDDDCVGATLELGQTLNCDSSLPGYVIDFQLNCGMCPYTFQEFGASYAAGCP